MNTGNRTIIVLTAVLIIIFTGCEKEAERLPVVPSVVNDIDGNSYSTVEISGQVWMAENLRVTKLNDGTQLSYISSDTGWEGSRLPAFSWYNHNEELYRQKLGALYNWHTVNTGKICPDGWHVPSYEEWLSLIDNLIRAGYNFDDSDSGNKVGKSLASYTEWAFSEVKGAVGNNDFPNKRNATGFTATPSGYRNSEGQFLGVGGVNIMWSASNGYYAMLTNNDQDLYVERQNYNNGYSIRCIKD